MSGQFKLYSIPVKFGFQNNSSSGVADNSVMFTWDQSGVYTQHVCDKMSPVVDQLTPGTVTMGTCPHSYLHKQPRAPFY